MLAAIAFAGGLILTPVIAQSPWPPGMDLTVPEALEQLARTNPDHFKRASALLKAASETSCNFGEMRAILVRVKATAVNCPQSLLLTSYPAKRQVSFMLDRTPYVARVTLRDAPPQAIPILK
jgi:hypothetical protein